MPFILDVLVIWIGAVILYCYRAELTKCLPSFVPTLLAFGILLVGLVMVEESINCIDYNDGLGCRMTPIINVVLCMYISLFALISRWSGRYKISLLVAVSVGVLWEVLFGGLQQLPLGWFFILMTIHVACSYLFILALPMYLLRKG